MTRLSVAVLGTLAASLLASSAAVAAPAGAPPAATSGATDTRAIERGRYLVKIGGCNDCHTPGYGESGGKVAEARWLIGDRLGWRGPWGTTYAPNLRLYFDKISERDWVKTAHTQEFRPPMPWYSLHAMTGPDLRAIYRFVRHLGPAGEPAPAYVPPNQEPPQPFVAFPPPPKQ